MLRKIRFFMWELGLIKINAKELNLPTEKEFLEGLGDASKIKAGPIKYE